MRNLHNEKRKIIISNYIRFLGGFEEDNDSNDMKEDNDSDEDPWADKTKEISFSTKSPEKKAKSSPHCKLTENNDSKGGGSSAESSDEEDQIKDHLKDSSLSSDKSSDSVFSPGSTVKATIESNSKMEIDDDPNNDDGKFFLKFSFSEKTTKFRSYLPIVLTADLLSKCQNKWKLQLRGN